MINITASLWVGYSLRARPRRSVQDLARNIRHDAHHTKPAELRQSVGSRIGDINALTTRHCELGGQRGFQLEVGFVCI